MWLLFAQEIHGQRKALVLRSFLSSRHVTERALSLSQISDWVSYLTTIWPPKANIFGWLTEIHIYVRRGGAYRSTPAPPSLWSPPCAMPLPSSVHHPSSHAKTTAEAAKHGNGDEEQHTPTNQDEEPTTHTKTTKTNPPSPAAILESLSLVRLSPLLWWGRGEANWLIMSYGQNSEYDGGNLT